MTRALSTARGVSPFGEVEFVTLVDADAGSWEFDASLYLWITDLAGEATVGDTTVDLDLDLWDDILKDLEGAAYRF